MNKVICPYCGSGLSRKGGYRYSEADGRLISKRFKCLECGRGFSIPISDDVKPNSLPRILLLDIETAPMEVYVWGLYKQFIPHGNVIKDWFILSWAAKWLYDDEILSSIVTPKEAIKRQDRRVMAEIWTLLDEADIIIGHNVDSFDERKIKARFILNKIPPPTPYRTIDTLKVARREFSLSSYKQDYITKRFDLNKKIDTSAFGGLDLWKRCVSGDKEALDIMLKYNKQDIRGLEDVYLKLRPYMRNHPNLGVMMDEDACPNCGSEHLEDTDAFYYTSASKFPVLRCQSCQTPYIRKAKALPRKTTLRSVAK